MSLLIDILGDSHLADTTRAAARLRGFRVCGSDGDGAPDLTLAAQDVEDHTDAGMADAYACFSSARSCARRDSTPLVLLSQVPPGTTRKWSEGLIVPPLYYQVDTIIMSCAVDRMHRPDRIIVGCADPEAPLPIAYQAYLAAHQCLVLKMSYESAELAKCAINYVLVEQISAARYLEAAANRVGANYADVERVLRSDVRIGPYAYLRPGYPNQHLKRDTATIFEILTDQYSGGEMRSLKP